MSSIQRINNVKIDIRTGKGKRGKGDIKENQFLIQIIVIILCGNP